MLNLNTNLLTKIEQLAIAIEESTGTQKTTLLDAWQQRYSYAYPKYAELGPLDVALVCLVRQRYPNAGWQNAILQQPVQCQVEADGDCLWAQGGQS